MQHDLPECYFSADEGRSYFGTGRIWAYLDDNQIEAYSQNCGRCPLRGVCHKSKGNRQIEVSLEGVRLRAAAVTQLKSDRGIALRKNRCYDVQPVFGSMKQNHGFRRYILRGKEKVAIETGLHSRPSNKLNGAPIER